MIEIIHHFGAFDGSCPTSQLVKCGSWFYGTTTVNPTLFRTDTNGYTVLHRFESSDPPVGRLLVDGNCIYGLTQKTLYQFAEPAYQTLMTFTAKPVAITIINGVIYGVTSGGGEYGKGTIFKYTAGSLVTLLSFSSETGKQPVDLIHTPRGLIGLTSEGGGLFQYELYVVNTDEGRPCIIEKGAYTILNRFQPICPNPGLIYFDGNLYGTTNRGGKYKKGTVYRYNFAEGSYTTLHSFGSKGDGYFPQSGPTLIGDSVLVGTTLFGGTSRTGTIYTYDMFRNVYKSLYSCAAAGDAPAVPQASLTVLEDRSLIFGCSKRGGAAGRGTIFRMLAPKSLPKSFTVMFTEGTKILTDAGWSHVGHLSIGALVKTYKHGFRRIIHISKWDTPNNPAVWHKSFYKAQREGFDPLVITGDRGLLVDTLTEQDEAQQKLYWGINRPTIEDMPLLVTAASQEFSQIRDISLYTYYMFYLDNGGDDDTLYGVYANGFLVEIPSKNQGLI
jgi:uncharacterized repeat protein (TIGR03803 family)